MKIKIEEYVATKQFNDRKLTNEEIGMISNFANLSTSEKEALADFVYALSLVLYKIYANASTELL
jgi:hypothetical protein